MDSKTTDRPVGHDFMRGRGRDRMDAADLAALEGLFGEIRTVGPREIVLPMGVPTTHSTYLIDGYMCRYMDDRAGRRQLVSLHLPGDFVDLHAFPLPYLDHDLATISTCRVANVSHDRLLAVQQSRPRLARVLWLSTLLDAAMHREWIFRLGRLDAVGRVAHLLCEIQFRLALIGRSSDGSFALPLLQNDLAETCGMTPVHVNRVLRRLRVEGVASFTGGQVTVHDRARLWRMAEFNTMYLYAGGDDRPEMNRGKPCEMRFTPPFGRD